MDNEQGEGSIYFTVCAAHIDFYKIKTNIIQRFIDDQIKFYLNKRGWGYFNHISSFTFVNFIDTY